MPDSGRSGDSCKHHSVDLALNQTRYFPEYYGRVHHRKGKPCRLTRATELKSTLDTSVSEFEIVQVLCRDPGAFEI